MRNKKAKQLRREAQLATVGMPDKKYIVTAKGRTIDTGHKNKDGSSIIRYNPDAIRLGQCTRGVYQMMKKRAV